MGKFYEYPTPSGIAAGDERIVLEKNGLTYSPNVSFIGIASLGDVDLTGLTDASILKWSNTNQKWEVGTDDTVVSTLNSIGDVSITTPSNGQVLTYSGGTWINSTAPTKFRITDEAILGGHTITESNLGNRLVFTIEGATNVILPQNSTEAIAVGFQCVVRYEAGIGQLDFVAEGTDVIHSPDGLTSITKQYGEVVVTKSASGVWELNGELA